MRALLVSIVSCLLGALVIAAVPPPPLSAFPGAEGFGALTPGGRGGRVIIVTNLDDSGPGSFRDAVTAKGPRIVVFGIGGLITLATPVVIEEPFVTIAGHTAPGDGICFRGHQVSIRTHDVVVRYLRFRLGDVAGAEEDSFDIVGDSHDVIVDHCSATWSVDENLSPSGGIRNITVQWCLIAEALNRSVHSKGAHGYGSLARAIGGVTFHHNLWAHNAARNPRLGDNYAKPPYPTFDVRNNVIYDYGEIASGMTGDHLSVNYVNNYVRPGPSSDRKRGIIVFTDTAESGYYIDGNVVDGREEWTADNTKMFDRMEFNGKRLVTVVKMPFDAPTVRTTTARRALQDVLVGVGAVLPRRDAVDARIVQSVERRDGAIIDSQLQVGGWPGYRAGQAPVDTDKDGLPDAWEKAHGLDPKDPGDASQPGSREGYTNIEVYLNDLAVRSPAPAAPPQILPPGVGTPAGPAVARPIVWQIDNLSKIGGRPVKAVGTPQVIDTDIGPAVEFNGTTDGLFVDVNPIVGLKRFTVEVLLQPATEGPEEQRFLHLSEVGSENRLMMETRLLPGAVWSLDTFLRSGESSRTLLDRAVTHPAGQWYVASLVYDGQTMAHYVNGVRELSGPVEFAAMAGGQTSIGVRQNLVSWYKGRVRAIRVTPEALSPDRMMKVPSAK
ncbi:MAG TPA: LamG-like jellyroll fold domain-containing protein [Vicinamibacterales bacterium]